MNLGKTGVVPKQTKNPQNSMDFQGQFSTCLNPFCAGCNMATTTRGEGERKGSFTFLELAYIEGLQVGRHQPRSLLLQVIFFLFPFFLVTLPFCLPQFSSADWKTESTWGAPYVQEALLWTISQLAFNLELSIISLSAASDSKANRRGVSTWRGLCLCESLRHHPTLTFSVGKPL